MPSPLFDRSFVYPSDGTGTYIDLSGTVTASSRLDEGDPARVVVATAKGAFTGFWSGRGLPAVGDQATIRVYDSGGGFYPDDVILSFGVKEAAPAQVPQPPAGP